MVRAERDADVGSGLARIGAEKRSCLRRIAKILFIAKPRNRTS